MDEPDAAELSLSVTILEKLVTNHRHFFGFLEHRLGSRTEAEKRASMRGRKSAGAHLPAAR